MQYARYVLQALSTLTQECADDERVEDPDAIRYPDRAPSEDSQILE